MNRISLVTRTIAAGFLAVVVAASTGCTMKNQDAPPLTGPSGYGTEITVAVSPDVLTQDGASQSVVTITAHDANGNPLRSLSVRAEIFVGGTRVDFGSLSARSLVTDANGRATLVYTAPAAPAGPPVDTKTSVNIVVTPIGTDFNNAVARMATIRLIPAGGGVVPPDGLQPAFTFTPSSPTDHENVLFDATTSVAPANNPIAAYAWNFGDGITGSGARATHAYNLPGTYVVALTISDALNRSATTSQVLTVGGGVTPSASFVTSPATPRIGQVVNFNASASLPAPGRTIRTYGWDFGDGDTKTTSTPITTHDYLTSGAFTVTLVVTDDAGRVATATGSVTVASDAPTADFTFSQLPPTSAHTVRFDPSGSSAIQGRTITSYSWDFGDGSAPSTQATPTHTYGGAGTFNVTLTVTDSAGKTGKVTKTVTVG
jgi:PKD repeat protein